MNKTIRDLVAKFGKLPVSIDQVADDADLYAAGLTSFASVQL
ncbi:acyl carrier protein, partial [Pseudomonas sp. BGM005]|nr:acyl carrier protein [Pseudomonas sp. BG5]